MINHKFMLVDDNLIDLMVHKRLLQSAFPASTIMVFNSSSDGLNFLSEYRNKPEELPTILLLDIIMPRLDGFEFMEKLAQKYNEIPFAIFLLSSTIHDADFTKAEESTWVKTILGKPLDTDVLKEWL